MCSFFKLEWFSLILNSICLAMRFRCVCVSMSVWLSVSVCLCVFVCLFSHVSVGCVCVYVSVYMCLCMCVCACVLMCRCLGVYVCIVRLCWKLQVPSFYHVAALILILISSVGLASSVVCFQHQLLLELSQNLWTDLSLWSLLTLQSTLHIEL